MSSVLARIAGGCSGPPQASTRLHLKFEIGGSLLGKPLAMTYGQPATGGNPRSIGVLLGKREPPRLLIVSYRAMDVWPPGDEHRSLSEQWDRSFGGLVARIRWDPKLSGLHPVGWYRAEPNASLSLSRRDLDLFNRFFPESWQIGLILQSGESSTAGRIFLREPDRSIRPEAGFQDFVVQSDDADRPRVLVAPPSKTPAASSWPHPAGPQRGEKGSQMLWPAAALLAAAGIAVGAWWGLHPAKPARGAMSRVQSAVPDLKQEAARKADAIWQQWQKEAAQSSSESAQPSDSDAPPQPDLPIESTQEPGPVPPLSDLPASPTGLSAVTPAAKKPRTDRPEAEKQSAPRRPDPVQRPQSPRTFRPPDSTSRAGIVADVAPPAGERLEPFASSNAPPQPEIAPPPPVSTPSRTGTTPVIPPVSPPRAISQPAASVPASTPHVQTPGSASAPSTTPAVHRTSLEKPNAVTIPSSGRLIWTGRLKKNEVLVFDSGKPSVGSLTGRLPGKPVTISVSPGDLTRDGIVIYSAVKPRSGSVQESPGPENGWNRTLRDWDPNRATDVEVVEAPGPSNGWKRLILRSKKSRDSVIVVEWKTRF